MSGSKNLTEYGELLIAIKRRILSAQNLAFRSVNRELISLYWDIGKVIVETLEEKRWGSGVVDNLAKDLQEAFPGIKGFSAANLWRMRLFMRIRSYLFICGEFARGARVAGLEVVEQLY